MVTSVDLNTNLDMQFTVDVRFILTLWYMVAFGCKMKKRVAVDNGDL